MTLDVFVVAICAAVALGLVIGLEREIGQHPAGLRTNALVATGAALYVLMARSIDGGTDTSRVAAQIVSGIGFLGGGVILREGLSVRGLTTAATLWCSAAVGALCGTGLIRYAGIAAAAIVTTNFVLNPVSRWIDRKTARFSYVMANYRLKAVCAMAEERRIRHLVAQLIAAQHDLILQGIGIENTDQANRGLVVAEVEVPVRDEHLLQDIVAQLNADPSTSSVSWGRQS